MSMNLIDESKKYIEKFYCDGKWIEHCEITLYNNEVSEASKEFLFDFYKLLLQSKFMSKYTKMWLVSNMRSVKSMVELYNEQNIGMDKLLFNTVKSNINYDKNKISKYFDKDMLKNVMLYPEQYLEEYSGVLQTLNRRYYDYGEFNNALAIALPNNIFSDKIDDEAWDRLKVVLSILSKNNINSMHNGNMLREEIGYFNYLISTPRLNEEEISKLKEIKDILGIKE